MTQSPQPPSPRTDADPAAGLPERLLAVREFLAFKLGGEEYGIDILRVQEIRSFEKPTRIAQAPAHVLGVVNLRGVIVPVIDLRVQLGLERRAVDGFTVVIVLHVGGRIVGMVVDGVSDVVTLSPQQLRAAPGFESTIDGRHLMGLGALDERMLILLDIEQLMASPEMGLVDPGSA